MSGFHAPGGAGGEDAGAFVLSFGSLWPGHAWFDEAGSLCFAPTRFWAKGRPTAGRWVGFLCCIETRVGQRIDVGHTWGLDLLGLLNRPMDDGFNGLHRAGCIF